MDFFTSFSDIELKITRTRPANLKNMTFLTFTMVNSDFLAFPVSPLLNSNLGSVLPLPQ